MIAPCANGTHRSVHPSGARVESNTRQWFNYGSLDDPEWFSCCEVHTIARRRRNAWVGAIPERWVRAPRWVRRIAVWWYTRHPVLPTRDPEAEVRGAYARGLWDAACTDESHRTGSEQ